MPFLDLVFFESESNVRHRPCPWFGAFGHLLAGCSGVVGARFLASWGCHFWTLFSSNQKATLDTGHVHGSGPSGTSWQGVLVWWGRVFWHLGDAILDLVFFESESNVRHRPCPWFGAFGHLLAGCSGVVGARFLDILGMPFLDLVFFESESNVRHRPCPWFGAFGHLLAGCSGVVRARFFGILGMQFWTLFSSNQKATLGTGHVHGSGPSGTSWQGVLVWWGRVFWHLGDAISGPCFLRIRKQR